MTFNQIKYFVTVAECLSFTEAAKCLFITQPALSRQINAMEEEPQLKPIWAESFFRLLDSVLAACGFELQQIHIYNDEQACGGCVGNRGQAV